MAINNFLRPSSPTVQLHSHIFVNPKPNKIAKSYSQSFRDENP
jgi:hypothetical protein